MNWAQFDDLVSHMCLTGTVVASWSLTHEVAVSNPFTAMTNNFVTEFAEFSENIGGKLQYCGLYSVCIYIVTQECTELHRVRLLRQPGLKKFRLVV